MMMIAMRISAVMHWLVVSPGMHEQNEFPARLFLARLAVISPLCGWAEWTWPPMDMSPVLGAVVGAVVLAPLANFVALGFQALGQAVLSGNSGRRY